MARGPVILFEGDDYIGTAVNLAARLCDIAAPHEVLATPSITQIPEGVVAEPGGPVKIAGFPRRIPVIRLRRRGHWAARAAPPNGGFCPDLSVVTTERSGQKIMGKRQHPPSRVKTTMHLSGLWRVRAYVRPYAGAMVAMVLAAFAGLAAATTMPLVTKAVIDGPVARGDPPRRRPLALLALGLGVFEGGMAMLRRFVLANAATGMETDIRNDLYAHLQRLPVSFHDQWQSGQLLSRAMSRPGRHPPLRRLRPRVPRRQHRHLRRRASCLLLRMHVALGLVVAAVGRPDLLAVGDASSAATARCRAGCRTSRATSPR